MSVLVKPAAQPDRPRGSGGAIKNEIAQATMWAFYKSNPDRVVVKVAGFLKIRVRDLHILFELMAGPEPS